MANGPDAAPTTDADAAIDPDSGRGWILPFGGHRGYGLALMLEMLVSAGVTGRTAGTKRGRVVLEPADFAAIYLAYQPTLLGPVEGWRRPWLNSSANLNRSAPLFPRNAAD